MIIRNIAISFALASGLLLAACANIPAPPPITVNATTGQASVAPPPAPTATPTKGGLGDTVKSILTKYTADLANAYNMSGGAPPATPKDKLGNACLGDLVQLNNALGSSASSINAAGLKGLHVLTDIEALRLGVATLGNNNLLQGTISDCNAVVDDMKTRGLEIAGEFQGLLLALESQFVGGASALAIPAVGAMFGVP